MTGRVLCSLLLQYEFHMVLELIKKGHPEAERKVRTVWLVGQRLGWRRGWQRAGRAAAAGAAGRNSSTGNHQ